MELLMINETSKWLIHKFHSLPHLNMWFMYYANTSSTHFDPYNPDYLETILFWTTVPILFLIFILLLLIVYACCLVCNNVTSPSTAIVASQLTNQRHKSLRKRSNLNANKCFLALSIIILSISLGSLVLGSELLHYSFKDLSLNLHRFSAQFSQINNQTNSLKKSIGNDVFVSLNQIEMNMQFASSKVKNEIKSIRLALNQSLMAINSFDQLLYEQNAYASVLNQLESIENTRWSLMIGVCVVNLLLICLLTIGLARNSKGSLCFFAFSAVLALISIWILNALYLGLTVFISDYCINPREYTLQLGNYNNNNNNVIKMQIIQYYTQCPQKQKQQLPFQQDLFKIQSKLKTALTIYNENLSEMLKSQVSVLEASNFTQFIDSSSRQLNKVSSLIACDKTSVFYNNLIANLCSNSIYGLSLILISGILFGLILPLVICIIPQLWKKLDSLSVQLSLASTTTTNTSEEVHPFIGQVPTSNYQTNTTQRSTAMATRHYTNHESPNFQRLPSTDENPYMRHNTNGTLSQSYYIRSNGTIQRGTLQRGTMTGV